MEAYLWLGADKIITHALSNLSSDARKVLEYYAKKDVLELHDYYLPELGDWPLIYADFTLEHVFNISISTSLISVCRTLLYN